MSAHSRERSDDASSVSTLSSLAHAQVIESAATRKQGKPFVSQLLPEDAPPAEKPWLMTPDPRVRISWWITICVALLGVLFSGVLVYSGYATLPRVGKLCLVMEDDFNGDSLNTSIWTRQASMGGFGNGEFEMTTASDNNSYVRDGILYILPTLTSDIIGQANVLNGYTYNLTDCSDANTPQNVTGCSAVSNATAATVINPIMSARLHTRGSCSIRYGRIEIRAKMPRGDWIWPALWMLPVNNTYGPWPASGEIDIVESRGNDFDYPAKGRNYATSTLHWGPVPQLDLGWKTNGFWFQRRAGFDQAFHTYAVEWTEDFIWTYVDTRLDRMLDQRYLGGESGSFWSRGQFPDAVQNGTDRVLLNDIWSGGGPNAPFDQAFYLIMNVAVGGTNGYFPDNEGGKMWLNVDSTAMRDFAVHQDEWLPTWPTTIEDRAMQIDYVKMWQKC